MSICNIEHWPSVYIKMEGVINSELYEQFKKNIQLVLNECKKRNQKCLLYLDFLKITDYKYYYIYKVINHLSKLEKELDTNIKSIKITTNKKWEKTIQRLLNLINPNIVIDFNIDYK